MLVQHQREPFSPQGPNGNWNRKRNTVPRDSAALKAAPGNFWYQTPQTLTQTPCLQTTRFHTDLSCQAHCEPHRRTTVKVEALHGPTHSADPASRPRQPTPPNRVRRGGQAAGSKVSLVRARPAPSWARLPQELSGSPTWGSPVGSAPPAPPSSTFSHCRRLSTAPKPANGGRGGRKAGRPKPRRSRFRALGLLRPRRPETCPAVLEGREGGPVVLPTLQSCWT